MTSLRVALAPLSAGQRTRVREVYFSAGGTGGSLNNDKRRLLEQACFEVQNDLEHRLHGHPQIEILNAVRNLLLDDCSENETVPGLHYAKVEAVAASLPSKRELSDEQRAVLAERFRAALARGGSGG